MAGEASQKTTTKTCKLAAIMFTDIVGFSRQMGADEHTLQRKSEEKFSKEHRCINSLLFTLSASVPRAYFLPA